MEGEVYGYDESFNKVAMTPNDNLLTNSDFKSGIINQKGQTSYVGNGSNNFYTIDMWYATKNVTVTVHDGYVNFKNNSTETNYVIQILNEQIDENYCSAVNVKSIVGTCFLRTQNKDFTKLHEDLNLVKGLNIISFNGAVERTGIYLEANASIDIEYMKLEKGKYFTGMKEWNYGVEFLKCAHIYMNFYGQPVKRVGFIGTSMAYITYELPTIMVEDISCVIRPNTNMIWQTDNTASPKNTTITSAQVIAKQGNAITVQFNGEFGNSSWRVCYVTGVGIELDGYQY